MAVAYGDSIPPGEKHAAGVSLPEWRHAVGFGKHDAETWDYLKTGYPRFNIPKLVLTFGERLIQWAASTPGPLLAANSDESVRLYPSERIAKACQRFLEKAEEENGGVSGRVRIVRISSGGEREELGAVKSESSAKQNPHVGHVYAVSWPNRLADPAWEFWAHTGYGISSRLAEFWMDNAQFLKQAKSSSKGDWYETLPAEKAQQAADAMRSHIAGLYSSDDVKTSQEDVFLFQGGMCAITEAATSLRIRATKQSGGRKNFQAAVFGFPYVDTPETLSKILGFECSHYTHASSQEIDTLEAELASGKQIDALFTEFLTNPLIKAVDLERLHSLAVKFDFVVVVDDTIGNPVNTLVAPFCDIVCSSLTKMYSGKLNVMGGSAVVSPWSRHHDVLRENLASLHEPTWFPLDVLVMRENSANFERRVATASRNAEQIVALLRNHRLVREVLYPKGGTSQELYEKMQRPGRGYGILLTVHFHKPAVAVAFHDALELLKGPSFGTNFSLVCPYTVLAHYTELEWAAQYGVYEHAIRISIGIENLDVISQAITKALAAAETHGTA